MQAAQGACPRNLADGVLAPRIQASFGPSGALRDTPYGNPNFVDSTRLSIRGLFPQSICNKSYGEKSGLGFLGVSIWSKDNQPPINTMNADKSYCLDRRSSYLSAAGLFPVVWRFRPISSR
jgi:hypothetical protein